MPYNHLIGAYEPNAACDIMDCLCNACYEDQPRWAWFFYIYSFLVLNVLLLFGASYSLFMLWKTAAAAIHRNMRVLVFVILQCLIRIADQFVFMSTYDQVGLFDYLGCALACIAVLFTAVNVKYALDAASARPSSNKLTIFVIGTNSLIAIILLLGILGALLQIGELFTVATSLFGVVVIILLAVNTLWIVQLRKLLQVHASQTESSRSLTNTMTKILTTLQVFYFCGILAIFSIVYHAIASQQPYQWMVSWWLSRLCCLITMSRLVVFYKPEEKPDEPKITRLSCHSPPSRTSSHTKPSPMPRSASSNNLDPSEPGTPSGQSQASSGLPLKYSPPSRSFSGRRLDVPSGGLELLGSPRTSASKLGVLSILVKEQEDELSARHPVQGDELSTRNAIPDELSTRNAIPDEV